MRLIVCCAAMGLPRWVGKSGQVWVEIDRTDHWVTLIPEYGYFDGMSEVAKTELTIGMFDELGMVKHG